MYKISDPSKLFYFYDTQNDVRYVFKNEDELVAHISKKYYDYSYFPSRWQLFDGAGRNINILLYEEKVKLYLKKYKNFLVNFNTKKRVKNKKYKGIFRETPVSNINEYYGRRLPKKNAKMKHVLLMWSDPEYKEYNRGNRYYYWFDRDRKTERNWKTQRNHQWK